MTKETFWGQGASLRCVSLCPTGVGRQFQEFIRKTRVSHSTNIRNTEDAA